MMRLNRRDMLSGVGATVLATSALVRTAGAGDRPAESELPTMDKVVAVTYTQSSKPNQPPTALPTQVHDIDDETAETMKENGGVKRMKAKDWKAKTPQERDQYLRDLKDTLPKDTRLILTVPKGEIWQIPEDKWLELKDKEVHEWTPEEFNHVLGVDPATQQSRTIAPPDEEMDSYAHDDRGGTRGPPPRDPIP
jgi:hypothetical protein